MSKEIDWSKAPEGATHYTNATDDYHAAFWRNDNGKAVELWVVHPSGDIRHVKDPYPSTSEIDRMIEIPKSWAGTGLPPIGTVCEVEAFHVGRGEWTVVEVLAHAKHDEDDALLVCEIDHDGDRADMHGIIYRPHCFRPIRTQAQIEADEREKAIQQMVEDADYDGPTARGIYAKLYDEGYRK